MGGWQHLGVPVAGPMDWYSHRLANRLVGNEDDAGLPGRGDHGVGVFQ